MTPARLMELRGFERLPMHNYKVLFDALAECLDEIERLQANEEGIARLQELRYSMERQLASSEEELKECKARRDALIQRLMVQEQRLDDFVRLVTQQPIASNYVVMPV